MNIPSIVFAVVAFGAAVIAARYSSKAGKTEIGPGGPDWGLPGTGAHIEPVTTEGKVLDLSVASIKSDQAVREALGKTGGLNKIAVRWALASAAASLASAVLGAMAS
jgi:hypothetical protein